MTHAIDSTMISADFIPTTHNTVSMARIHDEATKLAKTDNSSGYGAQVD